MIVKGPIKIILALHCDSLDVITYCVNHMRVYLSSWWFGYSFFKCDVTPTSIHWFDVLVILKRFATAAFDSTANHSTLVSPFILSFARNLRFPFNKVKAIF